MAEGRGGFTPQVSADEWQRRTVDDLKQMVRDLTVRLDGAEKAIGKLEKKVADLAKKAGKKNGNSQRGKGQGASRNRK